MRGGGDERNPARQAKLRDCLDGLRALPVQGVRRHYCVRIFSQNRGKICIQNWIQEPDTILLEVGAIEDQCARILLITIPVDLVATTAKRSSEHIEPSLAPHIAD